MGRRPARPRPAPPAHAATAPSAHHETPRPVWDHRGPARDGGRRCGRARDLCRCRGHGRCGRWERPLRASRTHRESHRRTRATYTRLMPPTDDATPQPIVRLRAVRKAFNATPILRGVDLDLPTGETTVILGPSGCGKSVTLKHIVGLLTPDEGEIWFENTRVDQTPEHKLGPIRRQIGLLFQLSALFDSMTVAENVEFPLLEADEGTPQDRAQRVQEALDTVGMHGYERRLPAELSGGQRKRVALARAIVVRPRVMLYDEPTTGLDPIRADGIDKLVVKLKQTLGVTSLVVTHDLTSAKKVADRVVVMFHGEIIAEGSYDDMLRSEDPRIQRFMRGEYHAEDDAPAAQGERAPAPTQRERTGAA
ncbi:MAG: ATP-binding cassette domain-containing protein [Phycisphaerales bacterium]|nr:MAG: ATP-binding cassette domain-containing protein [Phycisphaerales bacterium]